MYKLLIIITFIASVAVSDVFSQETKSPQLKQINFDSFQSHYFKNPPKEARPQVWWWWLRTQTNEAAITLDLEEMKAKSLSGCMVYDGGVAPFGPHKWKQKTIIDSTEIRFENTDEYKGGYLGEHSEKLDMWSKPWREMVRFASKEAGRLGLDFGVLIGSAGCNAPWVTPEYGQQELMWDDTIVSGGRNIAIKLRKPQKRIGTAVQRDDKLTIDAQNSSYHDVAVLAFPKADIVQMNEIVDLSGKLDLQGNLKWKAPKGQWKILRLGYRPTGRNDKGLFFIDHLSKEAFDMHWEKTAGLLLAEMSAEERAAFKFVECDSWEAGNPNWTKNFPQEFKNRRGYDIYKYLPVLAGYTVGSQPKSEGFKNDYKLTVSDLITEYHYQKHQEVAHQNGLQSYAEAAGPHQFQADLLKCVGKCDVAMGEFWMPSPHRPKVSSRFLVRESATAAHIYGINRVLAESFTSVGPNWEVSPFMMKAAVDQAFCDGLNAICFHTYTHRPSLTDAPGITHSAGTHFDRNITWWNQSGAFVDYLSRCSYMLQQGNFSADVLFYKGHGIRSDADAFEWADGLKNPPATLGNGYDYDKCNEDVLLTRLSVNDGLLVLPDGMNYKVLAIDKDTPLSLKALQKLVELAKQGATIVGEPSQSFMGLNDDAKTYNQLEKSIWNNKNNGMYQLGKGRFVWNTTLREVLINMGILPDFEVSGVSEHGVFDYIHRKAANADLYYVCSRWQPTEQVECTFRVSGKQPELWDPVTGEIKLLSDFREENGQTIVPLKFDPCGSCFIVFKDSVTTQNKKANWISYSTVHEIDGSWEVRFDPEWGGPKSVTFENLTDWSQSLIDGIKYYSGTANYIKSFDMPVGSFKEGEQYYLDLGVVHELAQVKLNGTDLGVVWTKPFRVNISSHLKEKDNQLEIEVINLWVNRLTGDAFLPDEQKFTQTNIRKFTKNTKLLPSGLLGPILIRTTIKE